jgi:uncharacterized repeat protein (TIGR03803 family)
MRTSCLLLCLGTATAQAQSFTVLHRFSGPDGANPRAGLVVSNGTLFGTTCYGGANNSGTVFRMNADGSDFTVLRSFAASDGANPESELFLSGSNLYGTTVVGGVGGVGTIFKLNTDGTGFQIIKSFAIANKWDGANPRGGLVLSGNSLYGTTCVGGSFSSGTVFKVDTDGRNYVVLHHFGPNSSYGICPQATLTLSGKFLYGTTAYTVFKVDTNGTGFQTLMTGVGTSSSALTLCGSKLFGTSYIMDAGSAWGSLFSINTDGTGYSTIVGLGNRVGDFLGVYGPVLFSNRLYGSIGYKTNCASLSSLFQVNTNGTSYVTLHQFSDDDGIYSSGNLVFSGAALFGPTWGSTCSSSNLGIVFSLSFSADPPVVTNLFPSQTAEQGATVTFTAAAGGYAPCHYQWFFNGTTPVSGMALNSRLVLTNIQFSDAGAYTVIVTNLFGAMTSSPAMLNVIPSVQRRPVPGVKVTGETGSMLNVDYANSLSPAPNWTTLGSVSLTGTSQFYFDHTAPLPPQRFYRAWQTGTPGVVPTLNLNFVPAITLTGNVGDSLRLDYINQFGPTDAWFTLATVALTNTSQLYFDVSAPGQPQRLYRIVPAP